MQLPHKFGKYVLLKKIAHGGMAEIYRAKYYGERGFAKDVAVKRILPHWSSRKDFENMLIDEAKALVHLQHQNIVQVFELGKDADVFYISEEFVNGVDLRQVYKKHEEDDRVLSEKFACFIITEVLKALEFAHRQKGENGGLLNIVHRDISPQNILISYNGEVKLTDFGIAKGLHRDEETTTNRLKGKYAYMSPEQAMGETVDHRSDLYSVGVVFFEILTGRRLFSSENDFETIQNVRESRFPDGWEAGVSLDMRRILKKALVKDLSCRYQSAAEFLRDINDYVGLKKLHTYGLELSDYLNRLFPDNKIEKIEQVVEKPPSTKVMPDVSRVRRKYFVQRNVGQRYAALGILFIPLLLSGVYRSGNGGDNILIKKSEQTIKEAHKDSLDEINKGSIGPTMPDADRGTISISTYPAGAIGVLEYGDIKKNVVTPFVMASFDVDKEIEARVLLRKDGFKSIVDNVILNKENPSFNKVYKMKSSAPARISVQARPWGYVYISGVANKRESPLNGMKIKPGRHTVKVHYSPTDTWASASIDVRPGKSHRCIADFTRGGKMWCK